MKKITKQAIEPLLSKRDEPVLSIYMPTHRHPTPDHINQDKTRFKNLVHQARDEWKKQFNNNTVEDIFQQLIAKLDDIDFWKDATEGLAIFADSNDYQLYRLPLECDERVVIGPQFYVAPLLALLSHDQPFYVLSIATQDPQLFKGDMYGLEPVEAALPSSLEDALDIDEPLSVNTVKSSQGPGGPRGSIAPHGEGDSQEAENADRAHYFQIVEQAIVKSPDFDDSIPLLLAGTESTVGNFRAASRQLSNIAEAYLSGNFSKTPTNDIHDQAWPLIRQTVEQNVETDISKKLDELNGSGLASTDLDSINQAADSGRVDTLLVDMINQSNDTISDVDTGPILRLTIDDAKLPATLNQLIIKVAGQGGKVIGTSQDNMPDQAKAAAIYRYSL